MLLVTDLMPLISELNEAISIHATQHQSVLDAVKQKVSLNIVFNVYMFYYWPALEY